MHFFLKLNPPRAGFMQDMTDEERSIMMRHIAYWQPYVNDKTMLLMGPVLDPAGGYGVGVIDVESEERLNELLAADPANGLNRYEYHPMQVVTELK